MYLLVMDHREKLLISLYAIKYLKSFLFSAFSFLILLKDQDQQMKGYRDGFKFLEELQALVAGPTILPSLSFTCDNQCVCSHG